MTINGHYLLAKTLEVALRVVIVMHDNERF